MNKTDIEIIGISTVGSYDSWLMWAVASFYNSVDKIVVVNSGYDINSPESGPIHRLEREHKLLEEIDIHNKILEVNPTQSDIDRLFNTKCQIGKDEYGRAGNITLATTIAHNLPNPENKQRWILKLDSDQILNKITRQQLIDLIKQYPRKTGFRFAQTADYYHDLYHISPGLPDEFTNDGALMYLSFQNQRFGAQGSPDHHVDQEPITSTVTAHLRRINPPDVEPYEYHYKRLFYHILGPNQIMEHDYNRKTGQKLTYQQIREMAHDQAVSILREKGRLISELPFDERIPFEIPLVIEMGPLEYIKRGY